MRNNRITSIVLIFMLIGIFLCPDPSYSEALRVPLDTTYSREKLFMDKEVAKKTQHGIAPTITDEEYSKQLSSFLHDLGNKLVPTQSSLSILLLDISLHGYQTQDGSKEKLLSQIYTMKAKLEYPKEENMLYGLSITSRSRGDYSFYIREALKKIEFYKEVSNEVSNFTFLTPEEKAAFTDEQRKEIEKRVSNFGDAVKDVAEYIKGFEARAAKGRQIKIINLYEWSEAHLKPMLRFGGIIHTEVDIPKDLLLLADEYDLEQIFYNLITNSIRAIKKLPGEIKITARKNNENIVIEVSDNGPGLDISNIKSIAKERGGLPEEVISSMSEQEIFALIFEPWFTTRKGGGQGLGIVRDNVRRYGGDINVNSESGKGATFTITLPLTEDISAEPTKATPEPMVESETQAKRQEFKQALDQVSAQNITSESIRRREVLTKLGPQIEKYIQEICEDKSIKIALIPVGSALKGYADENSDVEYQIIIIEGSSIGEIKGGDINYKLNKLIEEEGFKGEPLLTRPIPIPSISNLLEGNIDPIDFLSMLFLPIAYGDKELIEKARKDIVLFAAKQKTPEEFWIRLQEKYFNHFRIKFSKINLKPHLRKWLTEQRVDPDSVNDIEFFNKKIKKELGLPSLDNMKILYHIPETISISSVSLGGGAELRSTLSSTEIKKLEGTKEMSIYLNQNTGQVGLAHIRGYGITDSSLEIINTYLQTNLVKDIVKIANKNPDKTINIVDWGCGEGTALNEIAKKLDEKYSDIKNVKLIGFSDTYYSEWQKANPKVIFILDIADNFTKYFSGTKIDLLYSFIGLAHIGIDEDRKVNSDEISYISNIANLFNDEGTIISYPGMHGLNKIENVGLIVQHKPQDTFMKFKKIKSNPDNTSQYKNPENIQSRKVLGQAI